MQRGFLSWLFYRAVKGKWAAVPKHPARVLLYVLASNRPMGNLYEAQKKGSAMQAILVAVKKMFAWLLAERAVLVTVKEVLGHARLL